MSALDLLDELWENPSFGITVAVLFGLLGCGIVSWIIFLAVTTAP
ncbi:MAG: hypothetical protein ACP5N6_07520 [Anaerolineae bacterium]